MPTTTQPARALPLDSRIGAKLPVLADDAAVAALEAIAFDERVAALSTLDALRIGAALNPSAPALEYLANADPDEEPLTVTHAQLLARVHQAANLFHALGVQPGDTVSILLPLVPQSFVALWGAEAAGIANPVNPLLEPEQIAGILAAAGTRVLVALGPVPNSDIWRKVEAIRARLPNLKTVLSVGGTPVGDTASLDFDTALAPQPGDRLISERRFAPADIAAYFHTGGTTGTPKLVPHTHRNQVYQAWVMNLLSPGEPGERLLFGLPLFHVGGALTQSLATLARGGSLVVLSAAGWRNPNAIGNVWRLLARYRPYTLSSVPTVLTAAMGVPIGDIDLSFLRASAGGGSAIPVAIGRLLQQRLGKPVLEVYGMTETASVLTMAYHDRPIRLGSAGLPAPYSRVRIVKMDDEGRLLGDCAVDEIGVVAMSGPGVFSGYLDASHNDGAFVAPGWVNSGDLGRLDVDGYLWITGRAKDLIIRGGHNIDPAVVEEALYGHPAVALAAVVGQPDALLGEKPIAYVQLKAGSRVAPEALLDYVRSLTNERAAVPAAIVLVDAIPLTGVGKVFKPELRRDAAQRVFANLLAPLAEAGARIAVEVRAHGSHGSLATIRIDGADESARQHVSAAIESAMIPFTLAHEIIWGPSQDAS